MWMIFIKNTEERNPNKKQKILLVFDNIIADMHNNENLITFFFSY